MKSDLSVIPVPEVMFDDRVTGRTADPGNPGKCLILACGALAVEIVALKRQLALSDEQFELQCLPASFHNTPQKIAPRVREILSERRGEFDRVLVGYGECGTGGALDRVLAEFDAQRLPHAHCYEFFAGAHLFSNIIENEIGSFFVTDYLVKNFDRLVIGGLGLDKKPHLRDAYFCHYKDLVYLAQTENEGLQKQARLAAIKLGLRYQFKLVGYGDLTAALGDVASAARPKRAGRALEPHVSR